MSNSHPRVRVKGRLTSVQYKDALSKRAADKFCVVFHKICKFRIFVISKNINNTTWLRRMLKVIIAADPVLCF